MTALKRYAAKKAAEACYKYLRKIHRNSSPATVGIFGETYNRIIRQGTKKP